MANWENTGIKAADFHSYFVLFLTDIVMDLFGFRPGRQVGHDYSNFNVWSGKQKVTQRRKFFTIPPQNLRNWVSHHISLLFILPEQFTWMSGKSYLNPSLHFLKENWLHSSSHLLTVYYKTQKNSQNNTTTTKSKQTKKTTSENNHLHTSKTPITVIL